MHLTAFTSLHLLAWWACCCLHLPVVLIYVLYVLVCLFFMRWTTVMYIVIQQMCEIYFFLTELKLQSRSDHKAVLCFFFFFNLAGSQTPTPLSDLCQWALIHFQPAPAAGQSQDQLTVQGAVALINQELIHTYSKSTAIVCLINLPQIVYALELNKNKN